MSPVSPDNAGGVSFNDHAAALVPTEDHFANHKDIRSRLSTLLCVFGYLTFSCFWTPLISQGLPLEKVTSGRGLSQGMVHCLMQDHKGFIWIGTKDGLNRYDGYDFRVFRHNSFDPASLPDNRIHGILEDSTGRFWISTAAGISLFNPATETFRNLDLPGMSGAQSAQENTITLSEDSNGAIWARSSDALYRFELPKGSYDPADLNILSLTPDNREPGDPYKDMILSGTMIQYNDSVYLVPISTRVSILTFHKEAHQLSLSTDFSVLPAAVQELLLEPGFKRLLPGKGNTFWLCDMNSVYQVTPSAVRTVIKDIRTHVPEWSPNEIWAIVSDHHGDLVIATIQGLVYIDPSGQVQLYKQADLRFSDYYWGPILFDQGDVLWLGTRGAGLFKTNFRATRFAASRKPDDQVIAWKGPSVRSLLQTKEGEVFIGRGSQVLILDPQSGEIDTLDSKTSSLDFCEDHQGTVWSAGTHLVEYAKDPVHGWGIQHSYPVPKNNFANGVKILESSDSVLWVLTIENLCKFNKANGSFTCYDYTTVSLPTDYVPEYPTIIEDRQGFLWLGTTVGLLRFDSHTKTFTHYQNDPKDQHSLATNIIRSIALDPIDPDHYLWLGYSGGGLDKFEMNTGSCMHFGEGDGLSDMTIYGILTDSDNNLWMSTNHGLTVMNPGTETFRTFSTEDGLLDDEFNSNAYYKTKDGVMLFGGIRGFNRFRPESVSHANPHIPHLAFTGLRISNKPVLPDQKDFPYPESITYAEALRIPPRYKSFSIEFSAFDFYAPDKNQYRYRLEDFDPEWEYTTDAHSATYTNIDPGKYTFSVKAANSDGVWNEDGISVQVIVLPPWYRTWWAYILYVLGIGGLLYFLRKKELQEQHLKHELELEHVEAEKFREVDSIKSRFFANISHELRTPLTLILGYLERADQQATSNTIRNSLQGATANSKKLLQLINQLLDLSKIDAGRMQMRRVRKDLIPFLKNILFAFESMASQHQIKLEFETRHDRLVFAFDADKLERVFTNLISNAVKFTPDGGEVVVSVSTSPASATQDADKCLVEVKDTGPGIPPDALPHVFDRFYQSDSPELRDKGGTGIGLALVKELVQLHGGEVSAANDVGKGAVFLVTLPMVQEGLVAEEIVESRGEGTDVSLASEIAAVETQPELSSEDATENEEGISSQDRLHILLVEDNEEIRTFIRGLLTEQHYRVSEAANGKEGLDLALEEIPDLILTDVMMPVMDGMTMSREIRSDIRTSHIPIIMLTAKAGEEDKIQGLETGVDSYLTKPVSSRELLARISNLIAQRRLLRERFGNIRTIRPSDVTVVSLDQAFLEKTFQLIETNLGESTFSVEAMADQLHMSVKHLNRKLTALIGRPPGQLIRNARMERAAELLEKQAANVSGIAYDVGFTAPENFSRSFKKHFGVTPTEYAQGIRKNT